MKNKIITKLKLQDYEKKYKNYKKHLMSFTKKEVAEFDKQANTIGERYVLNKNRWALIGDTYYEMPKKLSCRWFKGASASRRLLACIIPLGVVGALGGGGYGVYYLLTHNTNEASIDADYKDKIEIVSDTTDKDGNKVVTLKEKGENSIVSIDVTIGEHQCISTEYSYKQENKNNNWVLTIYKETLANHKGKVVIHPKTEIVTSPTIIGNHNVDIDSTEEIKFVAKDSKEKEMSVEWKVECQPANTLSIDNSGVLKVEDKTKGNIAATLTATSKADKTKSCTFEIEVASFSKLQFNGSEVSKSNDDISDSVVIPDRYFGNNNWNPVNCIGENAFKDCVNVTGVTIPNSINEIKAYAFSNINASSFIIPKDVSIIEANVFASTTLTSLSIADTTNTKWIIESSPDNDIIDVKSSTSDELATKMNENNTCRWVKPSFQYLDFEEFQISPTSKAYKVFYNGTTKIPQGTKIIIPSLVLIDGTKYPVTQIKDNAFNGWDNIEQCPTECANIGSFDIPSSITDIQWQAFNSTSCEVIDLSKCTSLAYIGNVCFTWSSSLKTVIFPEECKLASINEGMFSNSGITNITLPLSVNSIAESVFENCTSLKTVNIPSRVTFINKNVFKNCTALESITFDETVTRHWKISNDSGEAISWDLSQKSSDETKKALTETYLDRTWSKDYTPVETVKDTTETPIDWGQGKTLNTTTLGIQEGSTVVIYYEYNTTDYHCAQILSGNWTTELFSTDLTVEKSTFAFTFTAEALEIISGTGNEFVIQGHGFKITKVSLVN